MVQYQGYAQQKKKITAIDLPDQSKKIIAQGARVLEAMDLVHRTEMANADNWLAARRDADRQHLQSLQTRFDLKEENLALINRHSQDNFQTDIQSAKTEGENAERMWKALESITQTGAEYYKQQHEVWKKEQRHKGMVAGLMGNSQSIEEQAGRAIKASRDWTGWAQNQLLNGTDLITTTDQVTGEKIQIPVNQVSGAQQTSDALTQMAPEYMDSLGLDLTRNIPEMVQALDTMGRANASIVSDVVGKEAKRANWEGAQARLDTFQDDPTAKRGQLAYLAMTNVLSPDKAFDKVYIDGFAKAQNRDGSAKYTEQEVENIAKQTSMPGQPGVSIWDRFSQKFEDAFREREINNFRSQQNGHAVFTGKITNQLVKAFGEQYKNGTLNDETIDEGVKKLNEIGASQAQINRLEQYRDITEEAQNDEATAEMFEELASVGALQYDTVMGSNASSELKSKWLKKLEQTQSPTAKATLADVKSYVEGRGGFHFGQKKNPTIGRTVEIAQAQVTNKARDYMSQGMPPADAWSKSMSEFEKEFERDAGLGAGNKKDPGKDGRWTFDPSRGGYTSILNQPDPDRVYQDLINKTNESDFDYKEAGIIDEQVLRRKGSKSLKTGQYTVSPEARIVAGKLPGVSAIDVEAAQYDAYNIPIPKALQNNLDTENSVAPAVQEIIKNYPNQTNASFSFRATSDGLRAPSTVRSALMPFIAHLGPGGHQGGSGAHSDDDYAIHFHGTPANQSAEGYAANRYVMAEATMRHLGQGYNVYLGNARIMLTPGMSYDEVSRAMQTEQVAHTKPGRTQGGIDIQVIDRSRGGSIENQTRGIPFSLALGEVYNKGGYGREARVLPFN